MDIRHFPTHCTFYFIFLLIFIACVCVLLDNDVIKQFSIYFFIDKLHKIGLHKYEFNFQVLLIKQLKQTIEKKKSRKFLIINAPVTSLVCNEVCNRIVFLR